jgi:peptide/nickel transport system ATP-binding protein
VRVAFPVEGALRPAVDGVDLRLEDGTVSCLVGESGCGKTLIARTVMGLLPENARAEGSVRYRGREIMGLPERELRHLRGRHMAMVFQEPMTSLNPVLTIGDQTAEPLRVHEGMDRKNAREAATELLSKVGIPDAARRLDDYPHQLSGGMRQRVMIAMALACDPDLLVADEPTTALDATIQGQILRLILDLTKDRGKATLLITHDLAVVAQVADRVGVMYAGCLVERLDGADFFDRARHPYTLGLLRSVPGRTLPRPRRLPTIAGTVPPLAKRPSGCPFHPRCGEAMDVCRRDAPPDFDLGPGHRAACWRLGETVESAGA